MLLLATNNKGKLKEIEAALHGLGDPLRSLSDWADLPEPEENGRSFAENARLKAAYYHQATGLPALADDSGLVVDALDGRPGIYSARFAPTDEERISKLVGMLRHLDPVSQRSLRSARFICAMCLFSQERTIEVEGAVEGEILGEPRGQDGFGYDPLFFYPPLGKTFAELTRDEKNQVSHRARALEALRQELTRGSIG